MFVVVALYTVLQLPLFASGASSPGTAMASVRADSQPGTRLSSNGDSADTLALQRGAQQARELFLQGDFNGAVVAVDDTWQHLIASPPGSVFARNPKTWKFEAVDPDVA